jgi:predicted Fe-Mo cluster-binding NifX family protein
LDGASKNKHAAQNSPTKPYKAGEAYMKIAVVSDDAKTVSPHFGRAQYYLVYTVENGKITGQETRAKPGYKRNGNKPHENHGKCDSDSNSRHAEARHVDMMGAIMDCDVMLTRGMGKRAYEDLKIRSIQPIITDICEVQPALEAYLDETLIDHLELLH